MLDITGYEYHEAVKKLMEAYPVYSMNIINATELGISENITGKYNIEAVIALTYTVDETNKKIFLKTVNKLIKRTS